MLNFKSCLDPHSCFSSLYPAQKSVFLHLRFCFPPCVLCLPCLLLLSFSFMKMHLLCFLFSVSFFPYLLSFFFSSWIVNERVGWCCKQNFKGWPDVFHSIPFYCSLDSLFLKLIFVFIQAFIERETFASCVCSCELQDTAGKNNLFFESYQMQMLIPPLFTPFDSFKTWDFRFIFFSWF